MYLENRYSGEPAAIWVQFQTAAGTVTSLYRESCESLKKTNELAKQSGYQKRNIELFNWAKRKRRLIRREDLLAYLAENTLHHLRGRAFITIHTIALALLETSHAQDCHWWKTPNVAFEDTRRRTIFVPSGRGSDFDVCRALRHATRGLTTKKSGSRRTCWEIFHNVEFSNVKETLEAGNKKIANIFQATKHIASPGVASADTFDSNLHTFREALVTSPLSCVSRGSDLCAFITGEMASHEAAC
ncbi:hypothetical protein NQ317_007798 [Molorchus minor]|uniref:Uncharacterized protein n=1 Tax=Molorchus minor TaxID=1323400 RepID=A0ABQ9IYH4_9CUCU|nr:hypothetical protein NQ317_007798 [Molorchus minor]